MSYSIRSSRRADRDVTFIFEWIAKRSPGGAIRWLDAFESAVDHLRQNAANCSFAMEADDCGIDLRQSLFQTRRGRIYRLLFVIRDDQVHLVSVRGPGQDVVSFDDVNLPE
jgi:plasmid stabilization system protein ParE